MQASLRAATMAVRHCVMSSASLCAGIMIPTCVMARSAEPVTGRVMKFLLDCTMNRWIERALPRQSRVTGETRHAISTLMR